jgi:hypothetical protein
MYLWQFIANPETGILYLPYDYCSRTMVCALHRMMIGLRNLCELLQRFADVISFPKR